MAFTVLIMIHILICVGLIIVVLMQSSKGEGLAGAFGGGGVSGAVFGGRGAASFLSKATTILAVGFMVSCLSLSFMSAGRSGVASDGTATSSVTEAATRDAALQQEAQQQQQALEGVQPAEGETGDAAEDLFGTPPADSQ